MRTPNAELLHFLEQNIPYCLSLTHTTPIPISNLYASPQTLGKDRLAAVIGAYALFKNTNILVIDAGTCITYDFLNHQNEYLGGSITTGLQTKLKALHTFTATLPLVTLPPTPLQYNLQTSLIGNTTQNAIISGAVWGTVAEITETIQQYKQFLKNNNTLKNNRLKVIITGGDALFFKTQLKTKLVALPDLVLQGLNTILQYNASFLQQKKQFLQK